MDFYPINLNLKNKNVLIVGGGKVAFRKFKRLAAAGAVVKVVSPKFNSLFSDYIKEKSTKHLFLKRKFAEADFKNIFMIFAATNDQILNKEISILARKKNILINTVDSAENSDFTLPSVVENGKLLLTISTASNLPALSKKIRKKLEKEFGLEYQLLLEIMEEKRKNIINNINDKKLRKKIFRELGSDDFLNKIRKIIREFSQASTLKVDSADNQLDSQKNELTAKKREEILIIINLEIERLIQKLKADNSNFKS